MGGFRSASRWLQTPWGATLFCALGGGIGGLCADLLLHPITLASGRTALFGAIGGAIGGYVGSCLKRRAWR
jgi:hypothetical protein